MTVMSLSPESKRMEIDHDSSQSAKSKSSQILYTDDFATLPANGPVSHAHIIALSPNLICLTHDGGTARLQDVVVTTLFNHSSATLQSFLCPTVNTFKAIFGKQDIQLVIWRKGLEVFVRFPSPHALPAHQSDHLLIPTHRLEPLSTTHR